MDHPQVQLSRGKKASGLGASQGKSAASPGLQQQEHSPDCFCSETVSGLSPCEQGSVLKTVLWRVTTKFVLKEHWFTLHLTDPGSTSERVTEHRKLQISARKSREETKLTLRRVYIFSAMASRLPSQVWFDFLKVDCTICDAKRQAGQETWGNTTAAASVSTPGASTIEVEPSMEEETLSEASTTSSPSSGDWLARCIKLLMDRAGPFSPLRSKSA